MADLYKTISVIESWLKQPVLTPPPINKLYDALELLKTQKWTSVKERYPDKEGFYLVSADHGNYLPWIAEMKIFGGVKGFCNGATMPCVGAWMPLPQPYVNDNYLR